ncbi:MAG: M20 family peptidase [Deltaproteobacteria bacterium]|nr:M20 family peptidase [Deltaproteobacteria bacterium]MBW2393385.1 M20 family peptidase [Deltaproteobacteria bacterium]
MGWLRKEDQRLRRAGVAAVAIGILLAGVPAGANSPEERLAAALRFRTISPQDPAQFDPAPFVALRAYLEETFPRVHAELLRERVAEHSLLYTWKGSDPAQQPLLLTSHLDVVPVPEGTEESWEQPPFSGVIVDGHVWGRGALDDKVGVLATLEAVENLLASGFVPRRTVFLAFGHDEELGGDHGAAAITALLEERGIRLWFSLDEGMIIAADGALGVTRPIALIGIAEKGYLSLRMTARSPGGHSSMPAPGGSIGKLARAITALEENPMPQRSGGVFGEMLRALGPELPFWPRLFLTNPLFSWMSRSRLSSDPTANAFVRTTTAVTMAGAGTKENILPREAWAMVNFRIIPGDTSGAVIERVRKIVGPDIELEVVRAREPSPTADLHSDAYAVLRATIEEIAPDAVVAPALVVGGTDTKHYGRIADDSFRFMPLRVSLADRTRVHGVSERVAVEVYLEAISFYEALLRRSAGAP